MDRLQAKQPWNLANKAFADDQFPAQQRGVGQKATFSTRGQSLAGISSLIALAGTDIGRASAPFSASLVCHAMRRAGAMALGQLPASIVLGRVSIILWDTKT